MQISTDVISTIPELMNRQYVEAIADLLDQDNFEMHTILPKSTYGIYTNPVYDFTEYLTKMIRSFDNFHYDIERIYGNDTFAIMQVRVSGKFERPLFAYRAIQRHLVWTEMHMIELNEKGQIAHYWLASELLSGLLKQSFAYQEFIFTTLGLFFPEPEYAQLDRRFSPSYIDYSQTFGKQHGVENLIHGLKTMQDVYGNIRIIPHKVVGNGSYVFCFANYKSEQLDKDTLELYHLDEQALITDRWVFSRE